jgi:hypothetical protein
MSVSGAELARTLSVVTPMMVPVPPVAEVRGPLVGRAAELDRLAGLVGLTTPSSTTPSGAAEAGPESAVLLSGDAGVGKTRLLAELRENAQDAGYRVLVGHCLDFGCCGVVVGGAVVGGVFVVLSQSTVPASSFTLTPSNVSQPW